MKPYKKINFQEDIRLSDLMKHQGISKRTKRFMKDRLRLFKTKSATLLQMKVDKKNDSIDFKFVSTPTYGTDNSMVTIPDAMNMVPGDEYDQTIRITNFFSLMATNPNFVDMKSATIDDIKEVLWNADIKVWCDCPAFWWQGVSYYLTQEFDASIHPNNILPTVWDKRHNHGDGLICKHLDLIFNKMSIYANNMSSMLYKYLRK